MKLVVLLSLLLICPGKSLFSQTVPDLPKPAQTTAEHALNICKKTFVGSHSGYLLNKAAQDLSNDLDTLTKQVDNNLAKQVSAFEGQDITAKLITIAWDRKRHPERYDELIASYIHFKYNPGSHIRLTPEVQLKHATEEYRLAWEYLLLSPSIDLLGNSFQRRVTQALAKIDNPLSNLTIAYVFELTVLPQADEHDSFIEQYQECILRSLSDNPNQANLDILMHCISLWYKKPRLDTKRDLEDEKNGVGLSAPSYVRQLLFGNSQLPKIQEQWHDVIAAYKEANDVELEHKQMLGVVEELKPLKP